MAANLSPLIEARYPERELIQRMYRHSDSRNTNRYGSAPVEAPEYVRLLLLEYVLLWDKANSDPERLVALAAAGELAMRYGHPILGMRLLARAALDEDMVIEAEFVLQEAFVQQIRHARAQLECVEYANAWAAGQMLTLGESRAWLAVLHRLIGN